MKLSRRMKNTEKASQERLENAKLVASLSYLNKLETIIQNVCEYAEKNPNSFQSKLCVDSSTPSDTLTHITSLIPSLPPREADAGFAQPSPDAYPFRMALRVHYSHLSPSLLEREVVRGGRPLLVSGVCDNWNTNLFSLRWLEEHFGDWEMINSPRNIQTLEDLSGWTVGEYVKYLNEPPSDREHYLYGKDITCPKPWRDYLARTLNHYFAYQPRDLASHLNKTQQPETLMVYAGCENTYTPGHTDICGSVGHNIMVNADPESYALWFIASTKYENAAAKLWGHYGAALEHDNCFLPVERLANAGFPFYLVRQRKGDLVIVPPGGAHQVINMKGRSIKIAWNRITPSVVGRCYWEVLPLYHDICKTEVYRIKALAYYGLRYRIKRVVALYNDAVKKEKERENDDSNNKLRGSDLLRKRVLPTNIPEFERLRDEIQPLLQVVSELVDEEWVEPELMEEYNLKELKTVRFNDKLPHLRTCNFCNCDIFNRCYRCPACVTDYDVCLLCVGEGRGCKHNNQLVLMEHLPMRELHDVVEMGKKAMKLVMETFNRPVPSIPSFQPVRRPIATVAFDMVQRYKDMETQVRCHQCKRRKTLNYIVKCTKGGCRFLYCAMCLWNRYGLKQVVIARNRHWTCLSCRNACNCAACLRKRGVDPKEHEVLAAYEALVDISVVVPPAFASNTDAVAGVCDAAPKPARSQGYSAAEMERVKKGQLPHKGGSTYHQWVKTKRMRQPHTMLKDMKREWIKLQEEELSITLPPFLINNEDEHEHENDEGDTRNTQNDDDNTNYSSNSNNHTISSNLSQSTPSIVAVQNDTFVPEIAENMGETSNPSTTETKSNPSVASNTSLQHDQSNISTPNMTTPLETAEDINTSHNTYSKYSPSKQPNTVTPYSYANSLNQPGNYHIRVRKELWLSDDETGHIAMDIGEEMEEEYDGYGGGYGDGGYEYDEEDEYSRKRSYKHGRGRASSGGRKRVKNYAKQKRVNRRGSGYGSMNKRKRKWEEYEDDGRLKEHRRRDTGKRKREEFVEESGYSEGENANFNSYHTRSSSTTYNMRRRHSLPSYRRKYSSISTETSGLERGDVGVSQLYQQEEKRAKKKADAMNAIISEEFVGYGKTSPELIALDEDATLCILYTTQPIPYTEYITAYHRRAGRIPKRIIGTTEEGDPAIGYLCFCGLLKNSSQKFASHTRSCSVYKACSNPPLSASHAYFDQCSSLKVENNGDAGNIAHGNAAIVNGSGSIIGTASNTISNSNTPITTTTATASTDTTSSNFSITGNYRSGNEHDLDNSNSLSDYHDASDTVFNNMNVSDGNKNSGESGENTITFYHNTEDISTTDTANYTNANNTASTNATITSNSLTNELSAVSSTLISSTNCINNDTKYVSANEVSSDNAFYSPTIISSLLPSITSSTNNRCDPSPFPPVPAVASPPPPLSPFITTEESITTLKARDTLYTTNTTTKIVPHSQPFSAFALPPPSILGNAGNK